MSCKHGNLKCSECARDAELKALRERVTELEAAHRDILKRHDDGKCTCGGCCIARGALTGERGDNVAALKWAW